MRYLLKGHATIDGACGKNFEVVVESNDNNFKVYSTRQEDAVRAQHPAVNGHSVGRSREISMGLQWKTDHARHYASYPFGGCI